MTAIPLELISQRLETADVSFCRLGAPGEGSVLVTSSGARVLAASAPGSDENLFWLHPDFLKGGDIHTLGAGGMGGLRLWNAPESAYMWKGKAEPKTFANYAVQESMDPGDFKLTQPSPMTCLLEGEATLLDYRNGRSISFHIHRAIELSPLINAPVPGVRLRFRNTLQLRAADADARVDLWHLLQLPAGTTVGAAVVEDAKPLPYFNVENIGDWQMENRFFRWQSNGKRKSKIGISARDFRGRLISISETQKTIGVCVWDVPMLRDATYADAPPGQERDDQIVQFWDGFGFCEVEYHSPCVSPEAPIINDVSELVCYQVPREKADLIPSLTAT